MTIEACATQSARLGFKERYSLEYILVPADNSVRERSTREGEREKKRKWKKRKKERARSQDTKSERIDDQRDTEVRECRWPVQTLGAEGRQDEDGKADLTAEGQQGDEYGGQVRVISHRDDRSFPKLKLRR